MNKKVVSLFTGCGGLDLGFVGGFDVFAKSINETMHPQWIKSRHGQKVKLNNNPYDIVLANDLRPACQTIYDRYFNGQLGHNTPYYVSSVVDIVKAHSKGDGPLVGLKADIVTGGFPCQDFSLCGKRRGFNSERTHVGDKNVSAPSIESRGMLYYWMMRAIDIIRPKCFIAENVKGLALMEDVVSIMRSDFASVGSNGYVVLPGRVLYAPQYGIPQTRERIIFMGFNRSDLSKEAIAEFDSGYINTDPYPPITHKFIPKVDQIRVHQDPHLASAVSCYDVLSDLCEPPLSRDLSQRSYSKAAYLPNSQGRYEIELHGHGPTIRSEHHGNIEYRRLSATKGGKHVQELSKGLPERRLSVRECARLQSFPDDFTFVSTDADGRKSVSMSEAYKQIGNAVPPLLGYHIADRLNVIWDWLFN